MKSSVAVTTILVAILHLPSSTPQFITFDKEGKLGVRFGDYHAAVGLGGEVGSGSSGGLFAEAGTPYGQSARAGLSGAVGKEAHGKLYAGATAGGDVKASAGLGGGLTAQKAEGAGFATAQAGAHEASSGLGGVASDAKTSGFSFSKSKSYSSGGVSKFKQVDLRPVDIGNADKNVNVNFKADVTNEIKPVAFTPLKTNIETESDVKEVQPEYLLTKTYVRARKPHRHHLRKTVYFNTAVNGDSYAQPQAVQSYQPEIDKRVDIQVQNQAKANLDSAGQAAFTKQVTVRRNPTFFADIFNIPISTLQAVSNFLGNGAGAISVQKSASVKAGAYAE